MAGKILSIFSFLLLLIFAGCASSEVEQKDAADKKTGKDSVLVFEEAVPDTANKNLEIRSTLEKNNQAKEATTKSLKYSVQIGAFSTLEKADGFADVAKKKIKKELTVSFNESVKLFVVQVTPAFAVKADAETFRNQLWKHKAFKDAWIVLVDE
jgi:cell division septation protein DedD